MDERTTTQLITAAGSGDQSAWDVLVARYSGLVWSVARAHRLGPSDAADVFQTVWLRLVENLGKLREPEHLGGWLSSTARHECLRTIRISGREMADEDIALARDPADSGDGGAGDRARSDRLGVAPAPSPESALLAAEERAEVLAAYGRLSERCRVLLGLLVSDPAPSYTEISDALQMPVGSIGPTRGRCLNHLRRLLTAETDVEGRTR